MEMKEQCRREVVELHAFFEAWYRGALPETDEAFDRFASVLAPGFHIVSPDGRVHDREMALAGVRGGYGKRGIRIRIEGCVHRVSEGETILATYEEWQEEGEAMRGWVSSVLFRVNGGAPNGIEWLHVHETYLPVG